MAGSVCSSSNCTSVFPQDGRGAWAGSRSAICGLSVLSHRELKRRIFKEQALIKSVIFSTSLRTGLSELTFFPFLSAWGEEYSKKGVLFGGSSFIHISFVPSVQVSAQWQKRLLNICMKIGLTSQTPERVSGTPGGPWAILWERVWDAVSQNRFGSWWWIWVMFTFYLSLLVIFFFMICQQLQFLPDACSISLKETGRGNSPSVHSSCVSRVCFVVWS